MVIVPFETDISRTHRYQTLFSLVQTLYLSIYIDTANMKTTSILIALSAIIL